MNPFVLLLAGSCVAVMGVAWLALLWGVIRFVNAVLLDHDERCVCDEDK